MFTSREMKHRFYINFPFYTMKENTYLLEETYGSFDAIEEFFGYLTSFRISDYLVSE